MYLHIFACICMYTCSYIYKYVNILSVNEYFFLISIYACIYVYMYIYICIRPYMCIHLNRTFFPSGGLFHDIPGQRFICQILGRCVYVCACV